MKRKTNSRIIMAIVAAMVVTLILVVTVYSTTSPTRRLRKQLELGQQYLDNLDYEQAVAAFKEALQIDPDSESAKAGLEEAYMAWVDTFFEQKDYESARNLLDEALNVLPDSQYLKNAQVDVYLALAQHFASDKEYDKAIRVLEEGYASLGDQKLKEKKDEYKNIRQQLEGEKKAEEEQIEEKPHELEEQLEPEEGPEENEQTNAEAQAESNPGAEIATNPNAIDIVNYIGKSYEDVKAAFPGGSENRGNFTWTGDDIEYYHHANDGYLDWDFFVGKGSNENYVNDGLIHGVRFSAERSAIPSSGASYSIMGITPDMNHAAAQKIFVANGWMLIDSYSGINEEDGYLHAGYTYRKGEGELLFEEIEGGQISTYLILLDYH